MIMTMIMNNDCDDDDEDEDDHDYDDYDDTIDDHCHMPQYAKTI